MNVALCVISNNRPDYLHQTIKAAYQYLPDFDYRFIVDDGGDPTASITLASLYSQDWHVETHPENRGLAAAVQTGFDLVTSCDADYVFWLEEDMLLTRRPPIREAIDILDTHDHLAQMCFRREPVAVNPTETGYGCVLRTLTEQSDNVRTHDDPSRGIRWTEYDGLFSLNPCLIPAEICNIDWDPGNEAGMTIKLRDHGYMFGSWGLAGDGQTWVTHIGEQRGAKWQL